MKLVHFLFGKVNCSSYLCGVIINYYTLHRKSTQYKLINQTNMNKDSEIFKNYMAMVPNSQLSDLIDRIVKVCDIRRPTYSNWRTGRAKIPKKCKDKIEKLVGEKIWS